VILGTPGRGAIDVIGSDELPGVRDRNRVANDTAGRPRCSKCHADLPWLADVSATEFDAVIRRSTVPAFGPTSGRRGVVPAERSRRCHPSMGRWRSAGAQASLRNIF